MSKSSRKNKGVQTKSSKTSTSAAKDADRNSAQLPDSAEPLSTAPPSDSQQSPAEHQSIAPKTLIGAIQTDIYERLLQPAMISFGLRRDDEPLRQLVESIVTAIAMRDAYDGCRKIDDICQRYLYYLESVLGTSKKSWEAVELGALCDYWRTQVFMTLILDSSAIFELLLPDAQPVLPKPNQLAQNAFLCGIHTVLNDRMDPAIPIDRNNCSSRELFDFSHGISFPWTGFPTETIFGIQTTVHNSPSIEHEFAIAGKEETRFFDQKIQDSLKQSLLIDLIFAQHRKLYDELSTFFEPDDRLPADFCRQLESRVKFDKTYQQAYDSILAGIPLNRQLHRSSRLDYQTLNAYGCMASIVHRAAAQDAGVYLFHYVG